MELFLDLLCTIGFSLFLSFILAKLLSLSSNSKDTDFGFDLQTCSENNAKSAIGFVAKDVISRDEPKSSDFEIEDCKESEMLFSDEDDDWEGIERTELERVFGAAVSFVEFRINGDRVLNLSSDVKMELYGLHKVATVGPCHEPQPMAFKILARAKWNAWKCLGNMDSESAMEQYITLLSKNIPDWKQDDVDDDSGLSFEDAVAFKKVVYVAPNSPQS